MANVLLPKRRANHSGVVDSLCANWSASFKNAATPSSFPGFASKIVFPEFAR
jgi:hypothetical protein